MLRIFDSTRGAKIMYFVVYEPRSRFFV